MQIHDIYPFNEERKSRKRLGRGRATGQGCTAGHGNKGQLSRSGRGKGPGFEGGQMPLARRLPKGGFKPLCKVMYAPIDVNKLLEAFPGKNEITIEDIYSLGWCGKNQSVKILGKGKIDRAVKITAHRFSAGAADSIKAAGGNAEVLEG